MPADVTKLLSHLNSVEFWEGSIQEKYIINKEVAMMPRWV